MEASSLVLHGIKSTTSDIDISVYDELYNRLLSDYDCHFVALDDNGDTIYRIDEEITDELDFGKTFYLEDKDIKNIELINKFSSK